VESDFSLTSLVSIFRGQDAVISVIGGSGLGDQKLHVDAAVEAGVKRFMPSEFSTEDNSEAAQQLLPFFKTKTDLLDYLKEKEKEGLSWTALVCGPLLDWVSERIPLVTLMQFKLLHTVVVVTFKCHCPVFLNKKKLTNDLTVSEQRLYAIQHRQKDSGALG
jgi:hypothetical protein